MAFEFAIKNVLARPLLVQQGRETWKWLLNFMYRHPRLRLPKTQATSATRAKGFIKANVAKFFYICEPVLLLINFPHLLLSYDETGLDVVQHEVFISLKGKRTISLSSAERGSLVTIVTCMNATVTYAPPLLVFLGTT